jgi:ketopantoate hydroxymethyltransferase
VARRSGMRVPNTVGGGLIMLTGPAKPHVHCEVCKQKALVDALNGSVLWNKLTKEETPMSILDVLIPAEPIVRGFEAPRVVSFADPDEPGYKHANKHTKELIHAERVLAVANAIKQLGGECLSSQISQITELQVPVVSRILQTMRRCGLVSSRRIPGATARLWVKL